MGHRRAASSRGDLTPEHTQGSCTRTAWGTMSMATTTPRKWRPYCTVGGGWQVGRIVTKLADQHHTQGGGHAHTREGTATQGAITPRRQGSMTLVRHVHAQKPPRS